MTEILESTRAPSDPELIAGVRSGDLDAYGELFSRHADAALRLARQLTRGADAEDLVSEAFTKVMRTLTDGGGPDVAFRAYLLSAVRRLYVDRVRRDSRLTNSGDMTAFDPGVPFQDTVVTEFESSAAARAFATLPERWQLVLWHLEVENQKPADIAPLLGMSSNSVCALAYRAREGLRQAFLTAHLADTRDDDCRWAVERLSGYVRQGLAKRDSTKVKAHLDACRSCTAMYLELTEVNSDLRGVIAPLLLGTAAAGYLAGSGAGVGPLMMLLGRARDALFGGSGASAGTTTGTTTGATTGVTTGATTGATTGVTTGATTGAAAGATTTATAGTSAGVVGGAAAGTTAGSTAATMAVTAAGTTASTAAVTAGAATTAAATTAAATTVAAVGTGGAVAGVAAGTTAAVVVGAGAVGGVTTGVGAAGLAMIAVGTAAISLGIGAAHQQVDSTLPTTSPGAATSAPPDPGPVPSVPANAPAQVDLTVPQGAPPSSDPAALDLPAASGESLSGEADDSSSQAGDLSGAVLPGTDTGPGEVGESSGAGEGPTDEVAATSEPDPSPAPSDTPTPSETIPSESASAPPDGSGSPAVPTPSSPPSSSPDVSPELDAQPLDPSGGPTP